MSIELKHVTRVYHANVDVRALDDVSLSVATGEWLAIMGPSGSGKSTLVNLIGCLDRPTSGEIWIGGSNVGQMPPAGLNHFRENRPGHAEQHIGHARRPHVRDCSAPESTVDVDDDDRRARVAGAAESQTLQSDSECSPNS